MGMGFTGLATCMVNASRVWRPTAPACAHPGLQTDLLRRRRRTCGHPVAALHPTELLPARLRAAPGFHSRHAHSLVAAVILCAEARPKLIDAQVLRRKPPARAERCRRRRPKLRLRLRRAGGAIATGAQAESTLATTREKAARLWLVFMRAPEVVVFVK